MESNKKTKIIRILIITIFILVLITVGYFVFKFGKSFLSKEGRIEFAQKAEKIIDKAGIAGPLVYIGIVLFQVVIAIIPGEPIEILGGYLFGAFWGTVLCLIGMLLGTIIVYFLVKRYGKTLIGAVVKIQDKKKFSFLNDEKKLDSIVFILFLIPGTPKDVLTYLVPLTKMKASNYFLLSSLARLLSIVTSTIAGSALNKNRIVLMAVLFAITFAIGMFGIFYNQKIIDKIKSKKHKKTLDNTNTK